MSPAWRFLSALLLAGFWLAAGAAELKEGRDFRELNPPLAPDRAKVEVIEFFWYGCPHCFNLEPVVVPWSRKLPGDVSFRRVPALFPDGKWASGARLYYTLAAMNLVDRLHGEVFHAIHVERKRLGDERQFADWVSTKGVDPKEFLAAWNSFGVQSQVRQSQELTRRAGLSGVPALVVDGRYQAITPEHFPELLTLVDRLIERARAERGRK
jgi:thiol:disulfide interchange protein DsbA